MKPSVVPVTRYWPSGENRADSACDLPSCKSARSESARSESARNESARSEKARMSRDGMSVNVLD